MCVCVCVPTLVPVCVCVCASPSSLSPSEQSLMLVAPCSSVDHPEGQSVHADIPVAGAYLPMLHRRQDDDP